VTCAPVSGADGHLSGRRIGARPGRSGMPAVGRSRSSPTDRDFSLTAPSAAYLPPAPGQRCLGEDGCQPPSLAMNRTVVQCKPGRLEARALPGAKPAPFPGFIEPCHPTLRGQAPGGERLGARDQVRRLPRAPARGRPEIQLRLIRQENPQWTPHEMVAQATRPSAGSRSLVRCASKPAY
jgi:hypothetical protein